MTNVEQLKQNLGKLSPRDRDFANSLLDGFSRYGSLTPKQLFWVDKLNARVNAPQPAAVKIAVGSMKGVIALFDHAKQHLKHPKITLSLNGSPVTLAIAGAQAKAPGSINVMGEGKFPNREWFGRISPEGEWSPSRALDSDATKRDALLALLTEFANNPADVAKKFGILTGNCSFCMRPLSDDRSVAAGFGPICADHYGLTEEWKSAVHNQKQAELTETVNAAATATNTNGFFGDGTWRAPNATLNSWSLSIGTKVATLPMTI